MSSLLAHGKTRLRDATKSIGGAAVGALTIGMLRTTRYFDPIKIPPRTHELFHQLRLDNKPALIFTSHLSNWEMPALAAVAHGLDTAILFRKPNIASADRIIQVMRQDTMGMLIPAGRDAPFR